MAHTSDTEETKVFHKISQTFLLEILLVGSLLLQRWSSRYRRYSATHLIFAVVLRGVAQQPVAELEHVLVVNVLLIAQLGEV